MLFFSTGILSYTGLFQSREAAYLLTTPATTDRIFAYKFLEAMGFSSWGFVLLGSPMMVAYGINAQADPLVLRDVPALSDQLRGDPRQPGCGGIGHRREHLPAAASDSSPRWG